MDTIITVARRPEIFGPCTALVALALTVLVSELPGRLRGPNPAGIRTIAPTVALTAVRFAPLVIFVAGVLCILNQQSLEQASYLADIMAVCGGVGLASQFVGFLHETRQLRVEVGQAAAAQSTGAVPPPIITLPADHATAATAAAPATPSDLSRPQPAP